MATTAAQAWDAVTLNDRLAITGSSRDGFLLGFTAGWEAQQNRPFFCTFCGVEVIGETDGETVLKAQDHTRACEVHPLAIENRRLRDALDRFGAHVSIGCYVADDKNHAVCVCGLDDAKRLP